MLKAALEKLSPPQFIKTPDPAPIPEHAPKMYAPKFVEKAPEFRRVNEADFVDLQTWLVPRLMEKYERANPQGLMGWFHSVLHQNSYGFFRSANAVLLVESRIEPIEPTPIVREKFLRVRGLKSDPVETRKAQYEEGLKLYGVASDWAKAIKAARVEYGTDTDIPDGHMYDAIPNAKKKAYYTVAF